MNDELKLHLQECMQVLVKVIMNIERISQLLSIWAFLLIKIYTRRPKLQIVSLKPRPSSYVTFPASGRFSARSNLFH